mmetsp:Transcript_4281/g.6343  ORF Transcript_4281/g.6343 Transcript_4281/m.6343 type:complete len:87 (+) Transcript_4281:169-429(+)
MNNLALCLEYINITIQYNITFSSNVTKKINGQNRKKLQKRHARNLNLTILIKHLQCLDCCTGDNNQSHGVSLLPLSISFFLTEQPM